MKIITPLHHLHRGRNLILGILVNLQCNRTQQGPFLALFSLLELYSCTCPFFFIFLYFNLHIYVEEDIRNSKFGSICNMIYVSEFLKLSPFSQTKCTKANKTENITSLCDLTIGILKIELIFYDFMLKMQQKQEKITPLSDLHRGRNRTFEIWVNFQ